MNTKVAAPGPVAGQRATKSRWPARLDVLQGASGLILGLFMWGHMFFVSSILVSKDFMWSVTRFFEGYFVFGEAYPGIVSLVVAGVTVVFVVHAALALRKFPSDYRQYRRFMNHRSLLAHSDTTLWWVQVTTGFALFFLASPHLLQMLLHPAAIGPYGSADRVWSGGWWPVYLLLLFAVELHGGVGLYRLSLKWGWFESGDPRRTRRRLQIAKWSLTVFFLVLGLLTLTAYMKLGYEHRDDVGERYLPERYSEARSL
ncbi:MAG: fumarate reductase cytochrome b subunit [Halieaceae bacterium]|jgi:fumarate reductase subunit C|nr:fumarate reductase cytochrome b subunit [Halieaceae bacterium]